VRIEPDRVIRLGQITGAHGVKGWIKVHSFTKPRTNLLDYREWQLEHRGREWTVAVMAGRESGRKLIAKLAGIDDRDAAAELAGAAISVRRSELPELAADEFYWADLVGLEVQNTAGDRLGTVTGLIETGANDVLVLDGSDQHLIPFARGETVLRVDLENGEIIVDWDASFWE
jgi:16S rRNA processing protein RimM